MKAIAIFVVLALLFGAASAIEVNEGVNEGKNVSDSFNSIQSKEVFSEPVITDRNGYINLNVEGCSVFLSPGKPVMPVYKKVFAFPIGTKITGIEVIPGGIKEMPVHGKIMPAYEPVPPGMETQPIKKWEDRSVYGKASLYPEKWHEYKTMGGIKDGEHATLLVVSVYPVHYNPLGGMIKYADNVEIKVDYIPPEKPMLDNDVYDLLIVTPAEFSDALQPLVEHKESYGVKTMLVSLDEIYNGNYFTVQGRDDAEKVKYFIKNAIEEWGIDYVLLVGGRKPGVQEEWLMPVRYAWVYWVDEIKYISDLYFADIYDSDGQFSSWDTDENDVFSEWKSFGHLKDEMDLYPDVYLGRWACRSKAEVKIMVDKTIRYESTTASKRIVLAGGDNFEEGVDYEGETVCDKLLDCLPGFEAKKIYASQMDVTSDAMKEGLNEGAAFIHLHGHGSPIYWSTHKPGNIDPPVWEDGLKVYDLPLFFNKEYPIAVIGGCHTAMFNMSMTVHPWTGGIPYPEGLSWWFARKYGGGAIASLGYTAFPVATPGEEGDLDGDGINESDCAESGYGYMQIKLFYAYGIEGLQHLGECWGYTVGNYVEHFNSPPERWHLHTIQAFVLLGDPSLKIEGYP
ncbi:MAG: C25 family cysteine peptidase [Candidatus Thermoplasmatota archaeon]|nr:C25 family cysteine peptidase [Candidatus Thermoplasmatota archaeon]